MTFEAWAQHLEQAGSITRPSLGGSKELWTKEMYRHKDIGCLCCNERKRTKRVNTLRQLKNEAMESLGLIKCKDSMGRTIWE